MFEDSVAHESINTLPFPVIHPERSDLITRLLEQLSILKEEVEELKAAREEDQKTIQQLKLVVELYIDPDPRVLDPYHEDCMPLRVAAKSRTAAIRESPQRLLALEYWREEMEGTHAEPKQKSDAELLIALLLANNGKMLYQEARKKFPRLDKSGFSQLVKTMQDRIHTEVYHKDHRKKLLILNKKV